MQLNPVQTQRLASLQSYLEADPENVQLRADLFDAALEAGDLEVAGQQVSVVLQKTPDAKPWLHRQAVLCLARKDYPAAQTALEALISMGVNDVAVLYNLAFALFVQGQVEAARDRLAPVVDAAGEVMQPALALWLRCMHHLAQPDEGLRTFDSYASAHTVTEEVLGVAGLMALDAGRTDDAGAWSARALAANANRLEALVVQGSLVLGRQDMAAAQAFFERALAVNQTDGRSWSGLAFTYLLEQRLDLAHKAFHNAVRTMARHIGTWIGLGGARSCAGTCLRRIRPSPAHWRWTGISARATARWPWCWWRRASGPRRPGRLNWRLGWTRPVCQRATRRPCFLAR
ncbi:tetratricopeptide repeat protein [Ralstonia syzygii]|uniref:tetratricopeptide repeat protein n=1 Tax=Ralstonia syzygii TaxID=28097 RepID=UPI0036F33A35